MSWVRRVHEDGQLALLGHRLRLGRAAASQYVVVTLATGREELVVRLDGRVIGSYRHPSGDRVVRPLATSGR